MELRKKLAENIKVLMRHAGISSQAQLASASGISQTQIGNILRQEKGASVELLERLAHALECEPWLLLSPTAVLENPGDTDLSPLIYCYLRLHPNDQEAIWKMTHQLYEASCGSQLI